MKATNTHRKQRGFLAVGAGLALFAIYGALGLAVKTIEPKGDEAVSTQETVVIAEHKGE